MFNCYTWSIATQDRPARILLWTFGDLLWESRRGPDTHCLHHLRERLLKVRWHATAKTSAVADEAVQIIPFMATGVVQLIRAEDHLSSESFVEGIVHFSCC